MDKKRHISFNADNVAYPDITVEDEELKSREDCGSDEIFEDGIDETAAVPVFHFHRKKEPSDDAE
ncbi:MAG: hypothetical protein IKE27_12220 [Oscillospiraceae bacterium]|nr:hypothetical protein [Oscillospiraceae bacterium]